MNYHILREIADSWVLLAMFTFFIGVILWVIRPGSRDTYSETADIVFRHDKAPASDQDKEKNS